MEKQAEHGYGIWLDDLDESGFRWKKTLEAASALEEFADAKEAILPTDGEEAEKAAREWIEGYEGDGCHKGLAAFLAEAVSVENGIRVEAFDDAGVGAVYVRERLPWELNEKERSMGEDDWVEAISKWIRVLTDEPAKFGRLGETWWR